MIWVRKHLSRHGLTIHSVDQEPSNDVKEIFCRPQYIQTEISQKIQNILATLEAPKNTLAFITWKRKKYETARTL